MFLCLHVKAQKHACFHVFSPFSAHLYPPLHYNGKRSIKSIYIRNSCPPKFDIKIWLGGGGVGLGLKNNGSKANPTVVSSPVM